MQISKKSKVIQDHHASFEDVKGTNSFIMGEHEMI